MEAKEIYEKLLSKFDDGILEFKEDKTIDPYIKIKPEILPDLCFELRDNEDFLFDYLVNLTGMDYGKDLGVVYHLYSMKHKHRIVLKVDLNRDNPVIPSIEMIWKTANWHEREAYDMFGIIFEGHPFLVRILTPYDWEGYPLRKDYVTPEYYHGIKVPY